MLTRLRLECSLAVAWCLSEIDRWWGRDNRESTYQQQRRAKEREALRQRKDFERRVRLQRKGHW